MGRDATTTRLESILEARGVSRRAFMKLCGSVAVAMGLTELAAPRIAQALEESVIGVTEGKLFPVIWMEGASCTGCTESFGQVDTPDPATVILEMISLNYSETFSAAAGHSMEEARKQTIEAGNYLVIYEGAILRSFGGYSLRVDNMPGTEYFIETIKNAKAVVALGSCAVNGGWMAAHPNPSQAQGVQKFMADAGITGIPVVNIPGCPANPEWLVAVLVDVVLLGKYPDLNAENKPSLMFNQCIHENCQRRGHFENGEFVYQFGSEEEKKGYCLYAMGCRGPQTKANCGIVRYNHRRSWCIDAGAPCIGCCEADPLDPGHNWVEVNTPFMRRHRDLSLGDFKIAPGTIGLALVAFAAGALTVHGFGMKRTGRMDGGADFEKVRQWDLKHPDKSVGVYDQKDLEEAVAQRKQKDEKGGM